MKRLLQYLFALACFMAVFIAHQLWFIPQNRPLMIAFLDGPILILFSHATLWAYKKL